MYLFKTKLPTAQKATELSNKHRTKKFQKELDFITYEINSAAREGFKGIDLDEELSAELEQHLHALGYKTTQRTRLDKLTYTTISWL